MVRALRPMFLLLLLVLADLPATAQVTTGTPPFGSYGGGPETINLANLNSHLPFPVFHKAGRGLNFNFDLDYDSSIWTPVTSGSTTSWQMSSEWSSSILPLGHLVEKTTVTDGTCTLPNGRPAKTVTTIDKFTYVDGLGTPHPYNSRWGFFSSGCGGSTTYFGSENAPDGSGYLLNVTGGTVNQLNDRAGRILNVPVNSTSGTATVTDSNGNQISVNSSGVYTDTLGTTALTISGTAPSPVSYTYTAPSGASASFIVKYSPYTVQTNFGCSGITEYPATSANLISEIDLPDASKYSLTYEPTPGVPANVTGRLKSVTLPAGGTITYTYTGGSSGNITCADGSTPGLTRVLSDGASWSATWTYARTAGTGAAYTTTITDPERDTLAPNGNDTVLQFQGIYETQRQVYQGTHTAGTLTETLSTCYNATTPPCLSTAITLPIASRKVVTALAGGLQSEHDDFWNTYGAPTETDDYDYGNPTHGALLKKVLATYSTTLGNITAFKQTVITQNGSGSPVAQVNYNYDENTPTTTSGIPQHVSVTTPRGNLTSVNTYTNSTAYLTKKSSYYDTGTVSTTTDVNNAVTTYNYTAGLASCYNTFPTSINEAMSGMTTYATWNCTGGVQLTSEDENSQTTTTSYADQYFWRPASIQDPTSATTYYCYGLVTSGTCNINPNQSESYMTFNSNNSTNDTLTTIDGLGRPRVKQTRQSPTSATFDSVETDYDALGRSSRVTLPYSAAAGALNSTIAYTATTYDALSRPLTITDGGGGTLTYNYGQANDITLTRGPAPTWDSEHTKSRQFEYDGLGRLTSTCEITAGTSAWPGGTCAQTTHQTGYWTKYTYDPKGKMLSLTQNAQMSGSMQSRIFSYDWMSRRTAETVPEIGASGNGTANYIYDSDSTCGTSSGDLVKKIDAAGDLICSTYDLLHRQISTTYPSGTYSSVTPQKHFVYDSATVNSIAMTMVEGRLAEAYTCFAPCTTKLTDVGLSYSFRGEPSDVYESTPNSGTYYHIAQSYWADSGLAALSSNISGLPTFTYTPDGEGRLSSVSAASTALISSTVFNTASLPTAINLGSGSGDADSYTYDSNTNRMTQYQFTVNGTSLTAPLGWNANGTLQTQNITDGFNSSDTQNCSYQYDDIARVISANCGTAAAQTFAFDPFGNISVSGSPYSFSPSYSTSTNRMTAVGTFTPTYDGNGNLTNDDTHNYAWDADGHAITVDAGLSDAVSLTYDALGRMVEQNRSGTFTQIAYAPTGRKFALMRASSLQKAIVPLIGQSMAVYNSSGLLYYGHADSIGSIRLATTPGRAKYFDTAYTPFGDTYASWGGSNLDPAYTGQMNDTAHREDVVGGMYALYDFPAREYSVQGRWPNPDPAGVQATCPKNPQSQNRYAYVLGNPITRVDPTGMYSLDCNDEDPFCGYCQAFPNDPDCQNPCSFDSFDNPFCPLGGGGGSGGGGRGFVGGGSPTPQLPPPFPWPFLPIGFFNEPLSGNGTGIAKCDLVAPSFRGLGCIYLCSGPGGLAIAGKSCGPLDSKALKLCPFHAEFAGGQLVSPPDFCGETHP